MNHKLTFSLALVALLICNITFAQNNSDKKWNLPSTGANVGGVYSTLPSVNNYTGPTGTYRMYHTQIGDVLVPPNVIPYPTATATESEISGCNMGGNTNEMYASWNSYGPSFYGSGFCLTTNGGSTWTGNYNNMFASNNGGDPGTWIWPTGSTWSGRLGASDLNAAYTGCTAFYSTDNGVTWSNQVTLTPSGSVDKNLSCVDDIPGSPYLGRAYTLWSNFAISAAPIVCCFTSDGGATWVASTGNVSPAPDGSHYCQGVDVQVGPGGTVYAVWAYNILSSPYTEDYLGFAKSTNGGVTWTSGNNNAVNVNGIRTTALYNGIRADGFPRLAIDKSGGARNGWIYAVMSEKLVAPARDNSDVCLCRSTDGGTTWNHTLVNGDASGNYNWHPSPVVDNNGVLAIGYYDTRNTSVPVTQYYLSFSNNGGSSFSDIQVSDHNFTPAPISGLAGGYQGDYTGITYGNGKFWPFWADNSSGHYQCWTAGVSTVVLAHDYACGPFLNQQPYYVINTPYNIRTKVSNVGSSAETTVPIKYYVDGALINTTNLSLAAGGVDSVTNSWQTATTGNHNLMYIASLGTDLDRTNDTVRMTINVLATIPPSMCPFVCQPPTTYTPITGGSPGPTGDDAGITAPIGFTFQYVTNSYTQVWICTNGFIQMGPSGATDYVNSLCSTTDVNLIAGFWDDLNGANNITYLTTGTAPNRVFTVQYANVAFLSGSGNVTFQIKLYENGGTGQVVDIVYGTGVSNASATGSVGLNVAPGGSTHITSITPGATCASTTFSTTTCNDALGYSIPSGTFYRFCDLVGVDPISNAIPKVFSLEQNYPNPFNPTTVIKFGIPKSGLVKLVVYDLLGRTVETLVNEYKEAGSYKADFNATNLASGVYFYRLESGDFTSVKKMLLVK